jgi:hypothetical protein
MARRNTGDPILDKLAKRKNMAGYELRGSYEAPKKETKQIAGNVTPRRGKRVEGPDKDYTGRRNIWNQEKNRATTREKSTDRTGKVTEKKITTKTRTVSPRRTVVTTGGSVASPASKKGYNPIINPGGKIVQEGKIKTIRNKRVDRFLEKNPGYKVGDRNLKTKVKTETKTYNQKYPDRVFEYKTRTSKKGRLGAAREYQAKSIPRKILQSVPHVLAALGGRYHLKK